MLEFLSLAFAMVLVLSAVASAKDDDDTARLTGILQDGLAQRGTWLSVHVAEYLVSLGNPQPVRAAFAPQAESAPPPFRIGVWRVLALSAATPQAHDDYVQRMRHVLLDANASDRLHAMEALAKIAAPITSDSERLYVRKSAASGDGSAPFALWRLALDGDATSLDHLANLLKSPDSTTRFRAAYVLGRLRPLAKRPAQALADALKHEPHDSLAWPAIASASGGQPLVELAASADVAARRLAAATLAQQGDADRSLLEKLSRDDDLDVRMAAAFALLAHHASTLPVSLPQRLH